MRIRLLLDEQINKYRSLDSWFKTPQGSRVAQAFVDELSQVNEQLYGERLIQLGHCGDDLWLSAFKFRDKSIVSPFSVQKKTTVLASLTLLPIERDSIDCVIAPLTLEAFPHSKNPMDEIDRVLKPMGYAVFLGINPVSFWGAALRWGHLGCFGKTQVSLTSSLTVKRMMLLRGYRQCALTSFYYIPPVANEFLIRNLAFFNEMGKMVWPFPAAFYCLIVQKYQYSPPAIRFNVVGAELLINQKSSLAATSKWIHE